MRYKEQDKYLHSAADFAGGLWPSSQWGQQCLATSPSNVSLYSQEPHLGARSVGGGGVVYHLGSPLD